MAIKVVPNEVAGWDVVREDEDAAMSNHPTRESAEKAAQIRSDEERVNDAGGEPVEVHEDEVHGIDDDRKGMAPAFLFLGGLLALVILLLVILALTGSLTGFGS